nr:retrovirus-related Pol polyprotein from transposon TNT 1-94 [Tanacetum cinerariifolium]
MWNNQDLKRCLEMTLHAHLKVMALSNVMFDEKKGTIFNSSKEVVMIAPRVRDVYVLDMTSFAQESFFFAKASKNLNWLWHKRLAHLNFKIINKLAKQNLVISLASLVYSKDKPCSSCEKGKHHRANFETKQISSIKKCLHLLHMDLFRPVTSRSIDNEKYTLVIVDEYSRESILEREKHKREKDRRVNDRMMQLKKRKDNSSKAFDVGLVVTKSNETESERHVLSSRSENNTHTDDAHINSVIDKQPMAETYKYLSDSIKKTSVQTKDHADSLIVQLNCKTVENADLKAQLQEKKPALQPPRNQFVVRKPNAFKSERPNFSKPRFASQVDVNNVLSKPITLHYLPKVRESASAKLHHVNALDLLGIVKKNRALFQSRGGIDVSLLVTCKKVLNLLKKGLMVWREAKTTSTPPIKQAQVTYVSESASSSELKARTFITWKES